MPKNPNYQNSLIYKIVCNDTNIKNVYIGSTTSFRHRKQRHKTSCNNENTHSYNYPLYTFIRTNGGWDNWDMVLVDYTPCNTKLELHKIEREYIEKQDSNLVLNKVIPTRTQKEYDKIYYEANKDKISEKRKQYREDNRDEILEKCKEYYEDNKDKVLERQKKYREANKDKIKEKQSEKIVCDKCGKLSMRSNIKRHQQGNRCIKI